MEEVEVRTLLSTSILTVKDVVCRGTCRHRSEEECTTDTRLVFPYRGVYMRHVGRDDAVAEANQVLFFNAWEGYRVSHPVAGGDACLDLAIDDAHATRAGVQTKRARWREPDLRPPTLAH